MSEVPFPDAGGGVAFGFESARDGDFFGRQAAGGIAKDHPALFAAGHPGPDRQSAGQQRGAAGRANAGSDVEIGETQSFGGHSVEVRGPDGRMAVAA